MPLNFQMKVKILAAAVLLAASVEANAGLVEGDRYLAKGQYDLAYKELKPEADKGNAAAQFYLGTMYLEGQGVKQDVYVGVKLLEASANQGDSGAQLRLARIYYDGKVQKKSLEKSYVFARKAATQGVGEASMFLGVLYYKGAGVPQDSSVALALCRDASEKLATSVQRGEAVEAALTDSRKAVDVLEGRLTAEQKNEASKILAEWRSKHLLPGDASLSHPGKNGQ
ncbi:tetratricopeptide repeat protein [Pseudomonas sp. NPDC089918]|uniref:tetratricopeptide repeat protein n=1 Tax=Pseudomonas sp. NPDC089918 TaxID=3390654 RepID=UPI003D07EF20